MSRPDLIGYTALLGESVSSKVDLLDRLIGGVHHLSSGRYKERLLADVIREFLPRTVEVGTGFVLFPHADVNPPGGSQFHDPLNQSAYSVSRECDILVYDVMRHPVVFRDGDFVIIRPEAVRAVIEVKGSLSLQETRDALASFHHFAVKWRETQIFYRKLYGPITPKPPLFIMAWRISADAAGRRRTTPSSVCKAIAKFYAENVQLSEVDGYPFLEKLLIYNETEIIGGPHAKPKGEGVQYDFGWFCVDGRFARFEDGRVARRQDRTIAALLASLYQAVDEEGYNRFFDNLEEVRDRRVSTSALAWSDLSGSDFERIRSKVPYLSKSDT